ncbi:NADH-specific methylglyoxal reductase [Paenibacillus plantiphilus]|uniref:NADH-specific methylglyoxal reductase n=1 Tax=Paenibacillus plantiphilus TaxID=2905650 RepID=A0ABM9CBF3_9BACL|nr:aldo/keto reductase [Paenibacillus plantiphilus]CAH1208120.1 NADH-specific methylglyoxal reductase [Paenibacillus plantiphilus]
MEHMEIGRSGIKASVITLGAMGIGGGFRYPDTDDQESIRTIHAALDAGINMIDTAPVYGFGHSEEIIGKALKGRRDSVVLSTKCGLWWGDDEGTYRFTWDGHAVKRNLSSRTIRIEVEESLRRLNTDYIDVYYTHNPAMPPFNTPIEETIGTLMDLKKEGKIVTIGASNCDPHHIKSYLELGEVSIVQRRYNMLANDVEDEILPLCEANGISFHAYSPLANGLLTGKFGRDYQLPKGDSREGDPWWEPPLYHSALDFVESLNAIRQQLGCSQSALAIAYLRSKGEHINVICGIRTEKHLQENVAGAKLKLSQDIVAEIDRLRAQRLVRS